MRMNMAAMAPALAAHVPANVVIIAMAAAVVVLAVEEPVVAAAAALALEVAVMVDAAMIALAAAVVAAAEVAVALVVLVLALLLSAAWVVHVTIHSSIRGPMAALAMPMVSVWATMAAALVAATLAAAVDHLVAVISATMDSVAVAQMILVAAISWAAVAVPAICPAWVTLARVRAAVVAVPADSVRATIVWAMGWVLDSARATVWGTVWAL